MRIFLPLLSEARYVPRLTLTSFPQVLALLSQRLGKRARRDVGVQVLSEREQLILRIMREYLPDIMPPTPLVARFPWPLKRVPPPA